MTTVLLDVTGISKAFPGTLALDNVGLELLADQVHAVMGENEAIRHGISHLPEEPKAARLFVDVITKLNNESAVLHDLRGSSSTI